MREKITTLALLFNTLQIISLFSLLCTFLLLPGFSFLKSVYSFFLSFFPLSCSFLNLSLFLYIFYSLPLLSLFNFFLFYSLFSLFLLFSIFSFAAFLTTFFFFSSSLPTVSFSSIHLIFLVLLFLASFF